MNINKVTLSLAVASALGVFSSQTLAYTKFEMPNKSPSTLKFAVEEKGETVGSYHNLGYISGSCNAKATNVCGDLAVAFPLPANYAIDSFNYLQVQITLTGGAQFATAPKLHCKMGTAASPFSASLTIDPNSVVVNKSSALFNFPDNRFTMPSTAFCVVVASAYKLTTDDTDKKLVAGVSFRNIGAATTRNYSGTLISFVTANNSTISNIIQSTFPIFSNVVIDVAEDSKLFTTTTTESQVVAALGSVNYQKITASQVIRLAAKSAGAVTLADYIETATITVEGATLAAANKIYLAAPAGATYCNTPIISAAPAASVSFKLTPAQLIANPKINVCMELSTTNSVVMEPSQITANITTNPTDNMELVLNPSAGNLVEIVKNGATVRLLNIPTPNPVGDNAFVRIYNTGNSPITVRGRLYSQGGAQIGGALVLFGADGGINPALGANDVEVLSSAALQTAFGSWTGRAYLELEADTSPAIFKVQALIRDRSNTLVNMSDSTQND